MGAQLSADNESVNEELKAIHACLAGQKEAFATLYEAYVRNIYDFLFFRTFHKETAEDLTSETFLKALRNIDRYDGSKASFKTWIYRIARNTLIDHVRTRHETLDVAQQPEASTDAHLDAQFDAQQSVDEVKKILDTFPEEQRDIIIMRLWDQLSYAEISLILEKSPEACKMHFSRGMSALRKNLPNLATLLLFIYFNRL